MTDPFPFVVGSPRSGTTLLRVMLDVHPDLAVPGESYFVVGLYRALLQGSQSFDVQAFTESLLSHRWLRAWGIPEERFREALEHDSPQTYRDAIRLTYLTYARYQGKDRYGDKTPRYVLDLPLLAQLFPEARFVHLIRDGRDVALSLMDARPDIHGVRDAAKLWRRRVATGRRDGTQLGPDRYREVSYEELIERPAATLTSLCGFIDLSFDERMLRYHSRIDEGSFPRQTHLGRPPTKGLRDWRTQMSNDDLASFEAVAGDVLAEVGYERGLRRIPSRVALRTRSADLVESLQSSVRSAFPRPDKGSVSEGER